MRQSVLEKQESRQNPRRLQEMKGVGRTLDPGEDHIIHMFDFLAISNDYYLIYSYTVTESLFLGFMSEELVEIRTKTLLS